MGVYVPCLPSYIIMSLPFANIYKQLDTTSQELLGFQIFSQLQEIASFQTPCRVKLNLESMHKKQRALMCDQTDVPDYEEVVV